MIIAFPMGKAKLTPPASLKREYTGTKFDVVDHVGEAPAAPKLVVIGPVGPARRVGETIYTRIYYYFFF